MYVDEITTEGKEVVDAFVSSCLQPYLDKTIQWKEAQNISKGRYVHGSYKNEKDDIKYSHIFLHIFV